jgi:hypothetical protein
MGNDCFVTNVSPLILSLSERRGIDQFGKLIVVDSADSAKESNGRWESKAEIARKPPASEKATGFVKAIRNDQGSFSSPHKQTNVEESVILATSQPINDHETVMPCRLVDVGAVCLDCALFLLLVSPR